MRPETMHGWPTRRVGDTNHVAVLLPGRAYAAARPLLHFAGAVVARHGWTAQEVWWEPPVFDWDEPPDRDEALRWVGEQARRALDRENADYLLVVAKSLGTLAAPVAAQRDLPAIWLTPLLKLPSVVEALDRRTAPALLVGGTGDSSWDGELVRSLGVGYLEIPGADHGLEIEGDPVRSAEVLTQVTAAMDRFVEGLGP